MHFSFMAKRRWVAAGLLIVTAGCGAEAGRPSVSTSTTKAKVSGTVRIQGKAAQNGRITFDPSNIERKGAPVATAEIDKDGHYSLETFTGKNLVIVSPAKGTNAMPRPQQFDVNEGDNTIDVDYPPKS